MSRLNRLTWKNVFITMLGASLVSIAGFYATGMGGFAAVAGAIAIAFLLLAAWAWTIQVLVVGGERRLVAGYVVALIVAAVVSVAGLSATGIGDFAITGAIAIALLLMAAWVWIVQLRRERGDECCDLEGWEEVGPDDQDTQD